jgi:hypothetical protein
MGLGVQPWSFAHTVSNLTGKPPTGGGIGTGFTPGLSNADGSSVSVLSALAFDVHYLVVGLNGLNLAATATDALLDVLVDPAGGSSWSSLIDDLVCGYLPSNNREQHMGTMYSFPLYIPAGSSLGVRCRTASASSVTAGDPKVIMWAYGNPSRPSMWWCGSKVESLGISAATSKGTTVTPGNSGTYGSWATIGTSSGRYGAVQYGINGAGSAQTAVGYYWQIGTNSTQLPGSPTMFSTNDTTDMVSTAGNQGPIFCDIPESTVMQMRATCSGTAQAHNAAIYGVY